MISPSTLQTPPFENHRNKLTTYLSSSGRQKDGGFRRGNFKCKVLAKSIGERCIFGNGWLSACVREVGEMTKVSPRQQCPLAAGTDPDSQPVAQCPPAPMGYCNLVSFPDKDLTLTPDKVGTEVGILKRARGGKQPVRQVRFNITPRTEAITINPTRVSGEEPGVITVISEPSYSPSELQHFSKAGKGKRNHRKPKESKLKSKKLPSDGQSEDFTKGQSGGHCEGAELNTTLALKVELEELAEVAFDSRKAVQEQLKKSTHTKNNIAMRATEGVNIPRAQNLYQSLVSVSVSEDQLISRALRDRLTLVPANHSSKNQFQETPVEGPDLLAFYSPGELLRESPLLPLRESPLLPGDEVQQARPRPVPRPTHATFDLYHRHRQWEA
ncbi:hypothetical protein SKAU_G00371130 [Synaphobranchus kaupii]|uniref:Protein phosphatase 1 regulatory subunit 35 C-terminal domain-containing protein n=1 Tax=Synaphobranchus kaupii TaxID=118154 RepID=A0A9Q1IFU3_SYNKA|nr:hypothetical protein SKAU_G00371130 [Synaphobranchus kaupii]